MPQDAVESLESNLKQERDNLARLEKRRQNMLDRNGNVLREYISQERKLSDQIAVSRKEIEDLEQQLSDAKAGTTPVLQPALPIPRIETDLNIILNARRLGGRKRRAGVPVPSGQVFVLSHGHETFDQDGFPEVYLAGETVAKSRLRKDAECWVAELKEFPGSIGVTVTQRLAAISQTQNDVALMKLSWDVRLEDPITVLRRSGEWTTKEGRREFHEKMQRNIEGWMQQLLASDIQLWSADERDLYERIFSVLDGELGRIGLRLDTTVIPGAAVGAAAPRRSPPLMLRRYPSTLYEIVLQFARAEQLIFEAASAGGQAAIREQTGLAVKDLAAMQAASEQSMGRGAGLFLAVKNGKEETRRQTANWLESQAAATAATFVRTLYLEQHPDRDVKLTEQVLLAAFRNPVLTIGEWLDTGRESRSPSHFQRLRERLEER